MAILISPLVTSACVNGGVLGLAALWWGSWPDKECVTKMFSTDEYYDDNDMDLVFLNALFSIELCQTKLLNTTTPSKMPLGLPEPHN